MLLANWRKRDIAHWSFNHLWQLLPTASMRVAGSATALANARQALGDLFFLDACEERQQFDNFLAANRIYCFAVMKDGKLAYY